jgi:hypothetical protein
VQIENRDGPARESVVQLDLDTKSSPDEGRRGFCGTG